MKWAGYLKDWDGPQDGERPSAYIIVLGDKRISTNFLWDHGIACQSILLGATEKGLGGCMFGSVNKKALMEDLNIPDTFEVRSNCSWKPKEKVFLEEVDEMGIHTER